MIDSDGSAPIELTGPWPHALPGCLERAHLPWIPNRRRRRRHRRPGIPQRRRSGADPGGAPPARRSGALRPLRPHRQQRTFVHRHVRCRFRLLSPAVGLALALGMALEAGPALALGLAPAAAGRGGQRGDLVESQELVAMPGSGSADQGPKRGLEGVGRWERPLRRCRLERRAPGPTPAGLAAGKAPSGPERRGCRGLRLDQQLPGLLSLRLEGADLQRGGAPGQLVFAGMLEPGSRPLGCRQLRCRPEGPIELQVSALARSAVPQDSAGTALLQAQRAHGRCSLKRGHLNCQVRGDDGEEWRVDADL